MLDGQRYDIRPVLREEELLVIEDHWEDCVTSGIRLRRFFREPEAMWRQKDEWLAGELTLYFCFVVERQDNCFYEKRGTTTT